MNAFEASFCENISAKNLVFSNICVNTHTHTHTHYHHKRPPTLSFREIAKVYNSFQDLRFKIQKFKIAPKSPKGEFTAVQLRLFLVLSLSPFRGLGLLFKDSKSPSKSPRRGDFCGIGTPSHGFALGFLCNFRNFRDRVFAKAVSFIV